MTKTNDPVIADISMGDYLADPAYGSSDLHLFRAGPPLAVVERRRNREEDTAATRLGRAAHCRILQPKLFAATYVRKPAGMTFASKDGKAWREAVRAQGIDDSCILKDADWTAVEDVAMTFAEIPALAESLGDGSRAEHTVFWTDRHGLPRKARPDWFDHVAVYDLKVSIDAEVDLGLLRARALRNGWLHQLASHRQGIRAAGGKARVGRLVVISPNKPRIYRRLLEVGESDLDILELDLDTTSLDMVACHKSGVWPGLEEDWKAISLPEDHLLGDLDSEGIETGAEGDDEEHSDE